MGFGACAGRGVVAPEKIAEKHAESTGTKIYTAKKLDSTLLRGPTVTQVLGRPPLRARMERVSKPEEGVPSYGPVLQIGKAKFIDLRGEFAGYEWTHFHAGPKVISALDYTVEGLAWEVPIFLAQASRLEWERIDFKKPHFSAWVEAVMLELKTGALCVRIGISRGVEPGLKVTFSDPKSEEDFLDYVYDFADRVWKFQPMPRKFLPEHGSISSAQRMRALEKVSR